MRKLLVAATGVAFAAVLAVAGVAQAGTAVTPVGTLTATQVDGPCNDRGANVTVSVSGGFAGTAYTATGSEYSEPVHFATDGSGAGSGVVLNVLPPGGWTGTATITVTAGGGSGQVEVAIACDDPHGR